MRRLLRRFMRRSVLRSMRQVIRRGRMLPLVLVLCLLPVTAWAFRVVSPDCIEGGTVPRAQLLNGYGCHGDNISPELHWSDPPAGTRSYAVTLFDPDAPSPGGWWHWLVFDIPATADGLPAGAGSGPGLPAEAVQSRTSFGSTGYGGACPPPGPAHRYVLKVYALDVPSLGLTPDTPPIQVQRQLEAHALDRASIVTLYGR